MALAQELEFRVTLTLTLTFNFCSEQLGGGGGLEEKAVFAELQPTSPPMRRQGKAVFS